MDNNLRIFNNGRELPYPHLLVLGGVIIAYVAGIIVGLLF